jgi:bifunctional pyridoxal-dependent enzyme with beta-cystathionase and maltose regulon repressor activities
VKAHETLTDQEVETATSAAFDLASGYPQISIPEYIGDLYASHEISQQGLAFSPAWTPADQRATDEQLESALAALLDLNQDSYRFLGVTFSGGVALDRALAAAIALTTERLPSTETVQAHVVTTSPSIDIMKLLLLERRLLDIHLVESRLGGMGGLDADALVDEIGIIGRSTSLSRPVVLLTSPENPTGEVWSASALAMIAEACGQYGGVLIMDHSFLRAGIHGPYDVPAAWSVLPAGADWIALWDTGKTFGLNEDKLGFLVCGSDRTAKYVRDALRVIQFGVSRRLKIFFAELFREAARNDYVRDLRGICQINLDTAVRLSNSCTQVRATPAGSLAIVELKSSRYNDEQVRQRVLSQGVGVVIGRVFFHTAWRPTNLIRVALARDPKYFAEGFRRLVEEIETFGQ